MSDGLVFLGMPGYGELSAGASRGFWRATRRPDDRVYRQYNEGSLLAQNFNALWCAALNLTRAGYRVDYFAMQHADIEPEDWWLDTLIAELEAGEFDILGVVAPIKDVHGLSSLALARPDGDPWRPRCRLTMDEVRSLPPTFTSREVGAPLLLNTGLWACKFDVAWARKVHFEINDRIVQGPDGRYFAQVEPEDWYFSRLAHELGLAIGATRAVRLLHRGAVQFPNDRSWGEAFDAAYTDRSQPPPDAGPGFRFPRDVPGWLGYDEGRALYDLAGGKRVLEIGSYCGRSTICLAQSADHVIAYDTFDGRGTPEPRPTLAEFRANLGRYGVADRVAAAVAPDEIPARARFDLIFIDGAHDEASVRADIDRALAVLAPGGLLLFHDYRAEPGQFDGGWDPGVNRAVNDLLGRGAELISIHDSLAVVRPPAALPPEAL